MWTDADPQRGCVMRIGIDLGPVMPGECGGIVPLLKGVLNALFAGPPSHEFALFCNDANVGLFPNLPPAVELLILPGDRFFSALDRETARRNLDVLFRSFPTDDSL